MPAAESPAAETHGAKASAPVAQPAWLKPERFEADDFNPEACVADLRRYVSWCQPLWTDPEKQRGQGGRKRLAKKVRKEGRERAPQGRGVAGAAP